MFLNTIAPWHSGQESWAAVLTLAAVAGMAVSRDERAADSSALGSSRFTVAAFTTGSSVTSVFNISAASSEFYRRRVVDACGLHRPSRCIRDLCLQNRYLVPLHQQHALHGLQALRHGCVRLGLCLGAVGALLRKLSLQVLHLAAMPPNESG